jgi:vacuolar-type H+-ATPase subunit F/Vma7
MPGKNIVVIGDEDAVFGLGLIGLDGHVVTSVEQARETIRKAMADSTTALILLTENWSEALADAGPEALDESRAMIIEIPSPEPVKRSVTLEMRIEQALGVHLEG